MVSFRLPDVPVLVCQIITKRDPCLELLNSYLLPLPDLTSHKLKTTSPASPQIYLLLIHCCYHGQSRVLAWVCG